MSEKPRRWFQIHLSTAVVMMIVAGGLMFLNFSPSAPRILYNDFSVSGFTFSSSGRIATYGWPICVVPDYLDHFPRYGFNNWCVTALVVDGVLNLMAVFYTGRIANWWARREVRKP